MAGQRTFRDLIETGEHNGKPKCIVKNCNNPGQHTGNYRTDGSISYRKWCSIHHSKKTAKKHGLTSLQEVVAKNAGFKSVSQYQMHGLKKRAKAEGYIDVTDYLNSKHKYRKNRKTYCENIDGRIGFICTTTIVDKCMLTVDHINNKHEDDRSINHHTLCFCCHAVKTKTLGHLTNLSYIKKLMHQNALTFDKN